VTEEFVREVHRKKLKVIPWTVNEADVMRTLLKIGVDGIISDYPDRLTEANRQHQTLNK
jgi:glycerophosphoryl diester phosphodiesterase